MTYEIKKSWSLSRWLGKHCSCSLDIQFELTQWIGVVSGSEGRLELDEQG